MEKKKILIIEDETDLREAIKTALSYEQFIVCTAKDGEEGIEVALREKPDLIILDLLMPKVDGLAVLKALRADEWGREVKVIVMTALDDMEKISEVIDAGGDEYIVKTDITLNAVVDKVKKKLGV